MEQNTQISTPVQKDPIVIEKRNNWANLGEAAHNIELTLQASAQQSLAKIVLPYKIEGVPAAELILKEAKKDQANIELKRKEITSRLDSISARLMIPEKSFAAPLKTLEDTIISIKRADKLKQDAIKEKDAELIKCKEFLINHKNNSIATFNTKIVSWVDACYTHALGEGNITKEGVEEFITKALAKSTAAAFTITVPANTFPKITKEEYDKLCSELLASNPSIFLSDYENKLRFKFSDYEIALQNKAQALENSRLEKVAADKKIEEEKLNQQTASKLASIAITPTISAGVKPLKSAWAIDLPEDLPNSILIMTAFVANIGTINPMLTKVTKWNSFTVGQMANYLAKCKTLDEKFEYTGITFKTNDKL